MRQVEIVFLLVYLLILAVQDLRFHLISSKLLYGGMVAAVFTRILFPELSFLQSAAGAAAGIFFLTISKITDEQLGYGDSILILNLGIFLGLYQSTGILMLAFFLSSLFAGIVVAAGKFRRNHPYPFVPFLFLSTLIWECVI